MNYHDDHHHQFTLNHNYIYIKKNDIKLYFTPRTVHVYNIFINILYTQAQTQVKE